MRASCKNHIYLYIKSAKQEIESSKYTYSEKIHLSPIKYLQRIWIRAWLDESRGFQSGWSGTPVHAWLVTCSRGRPAYDGNHGNSISQSEPSKHSNRQNKQEKSKVNNYGLHAFGCKVLHIAKLHKRGIKYVCTHAYQSHTHILEILAKKKKILIVPSFIFYIQMYTETEDLCKYTSNYDKKPINYLYFRRNIISKIEAFVQSRLL